MIKQFNRIFSVSKQRFDIFKLKRQFWVSHIGFWTFKAPKVYLDQRVESEG